MIFVNDLVSTIGYTRGRLEHFSFSLWDSKHDFWLTIDHPTADEYVLLCDREIIDWMPEVADTDEEVVININVDLELEDIYRFPNAKKSGLY